MHALIINQMDCIPAWINGTRLVQLVEGLVGARQGQPEPEKITPGHFRRHFIILQGWLTPVTSAK